MPRLIALLFILFAPAPALASFGDCTTTEYFSRFPGSPDPLGSLCIEVFNVPVTTTSGIKHIRGIRHVSASWSFLPHADTHIGRGAHRAAETLERIGGFDMEDVTILILDDTHEALGARVDLDIAGEARPIKRPDGSTEDECLVTMYMFGRGASPDLIAKTAAHEIFHCAQFSTVSFNQMNNSRSDWWVEASAEYFAGLAIPRIEVANYWAGIFENKVDEGTPLFEMSYEAVVFFYWWHAEYGAAGLANFLTSMAEGESAAEHGAAMRSAIPNENWLDFAQSYVDGTIPFSDGTGLGLFTGLGEARHFVEAQNHSVTLAPFVLTRGEIKWNCGRWQNTTSPANVNASLRDQSTGAPIGAWGDMWEPVPTEVDTENSPEKSYRLAGFNTSNGNIELQIQAEYTQTCEPCAGSTELDSCVTGSWKQTGGGAVEWMKRMMAGSGASIPMHDPGPMIVIYNSDGTYTTKPFSQKLLVELEQGGESTRVDADGNLTAALGRWSIRGGQLAICQHSGGLSGMAEITPPAGAKVNMPFGSPGSGTLLNGYSCDSGTLSTSLPIPGTPSPITTEYSRISLP